MSTAPARANDPIWWCLLLALTFGALAAIRLTIPSAPYFDEVHYLPAARGLFSAASFSNQEHPMLGKEIIALSIALFGDTPLGWRLPSLFAGAFALYSFMRAVWFSTRTRFATLASGVLLGSGFLLFVHTRIAMLDIFMLAFFALALWQAAGAVRQPERGRWRLALAGGALGLAMAAKWNVAPLAPLFGLAFLAWRVKAGGWRFAFTHRGKPVPGITLAEAFLWLGVVPLAVYAATYFPAYFLPNGLSADHGLIAQHQKMFSLQSSVIEPHPYQSQWHQWMLNLRAIWYLYEPVDGAQRGVILLGNPLTMLLGLPALLWCLWAGIVQRRRDTLAVFVLYAASLGFWIVAAKPIQFYYHYLLPSCFLLIALALALDALWQRGKRWMPLGVLAASCAMFAWFYPILSAAPLAGPGSFAQWMWLDSWR